MKPKSILAATAFVIGIGIAFTAQPVHAAGCVKGAIVGGVAGHYAGNHGVLGAGAGCLVGHYAKKREREEMRRTAHEDERQWREYGGNPGRW